MNRWTACLQSRVRPLLLGMIHVRALPGTPLSKWGLQRIVSTAVKEAQVYERHNVDGVIIENMHDVPYLTSSTIGPEVTSCMTITGAEIRRACPDMPIGVQVLSACNKEAIAVALAADCDFIRAEAYIYSHVADEGLLNACAGDLLRYRSAIGANHISVLADIKKKHCAHAITSDVSVEQMAKDAEFFRADGLVVTGSSTAVPADRQQLLAVKSSASLPVLIGSGITADNLHTYSDSDALIVGSFMKKEGKWWEELDEKRISTLVAARDAL